MSTTESPNPLESDGEPDGAGVILYTADQVLLQKRDRRPRLYPGRWAIFGGGLQDGEPPDQAACREVAEELGYTIRPEELELLGRFQVTGASRNSLVHYYRCPLTRSWWDLVLALRHAPNLELEGDGLALFTHEELDYLHLRCPDRMALERHFQGPGFGFID